MGLFGVFNFLGYFNLSFFILVIGRILSEGGKLEFSMLLSGMSEYIVNNLVIKIIIIVKYIKS